MSFANTRQNQRRLPDKLFAPKEREIEGKCTQLLGYDGWRHIVTDPPHLRGLGVSEKGIPDRLYIRYGGPKVPPAPWRVGSKVRLNVYDGGGVAVCQCHDEVTAQYIVDAVNESKRGGRERAEVLWIEWKKLGGKASQHQQDWHTLERKRGALVWLAGVDFPASVEGFLDHYRASGLNRRPI